MVKVTLPKPTEKKPLSFLQSNEFFLVCFLCESLPLTNWILDSLLSKSDLWYASVFSVDYVYEDSGDVDNYIDSCGDIYCMTTIASALTLVVLLKL